MQLRLKVQRTNEDAYEVTTSLAVIVAWERRFKRRASDLGSGVGMEDLAFMAYEASKLNKIENLEVVDGEPETFTVPAASGDN